MQDIYSCFINNQSNNSECDQVLLTTVAHSRSTAADQVLACFSFLLLFLLASNKIYYIKERPTHPDYLSRLSLIGKKIETKHIKLYKVTNSVTNCLFSVFTRNNVQCILFRLQVYPHHGLGSNRLTCLYLSRYLCSFAIY